MRRWGYLMLVVFGFLLGLGLMLYPAISSYLMEKNQSTAMQEYIEERRMVPDEEKIRQKAEAQEYNQKLRLTGETNGYEDILDPNQDGLMGYLEIPSIKVYLPVYHGTSDGTLQSGIGHLQNTSLPVGGEGTHAVLSGHTGMPGARLLTDMDKLRDGDQFYLYVLDEVLAYEVDQIKTVTPEETGDLVPESGKDYVTLVTCTPYGINSHRLLVRGKRVPYVAEQKERQVNRQAESTWMQAYGQAVMTGVKWAALGLGVMIIILMLVSSCLGMTTVRAASIGSIQIQLKNLNSERSDRRGVTFALYQVGEIQKSGQLALDPLYQIPEYPVTAEEIEQVVQKLQTMVESPLITMETDSIGRAAVYGLSDGIYFVEATESDGYGIVEPLLIRIPSEDMESREVTAEPKASTREAGENASGLPQEIISPQTGDRSMTVGYMMLLSSAASLLCWLGIRMKK